MPVPNAYPSNDEAIQPGMMCETTIDGRNKLCIVMAYAHGWYMVRTWGSLPFAVHWRSVKN